MKEWKVRHKLFHMLYQGEDLGDDLSKETIIFEEEDKKIIQRALEYPVKQTKELYYPGKSYAVAIIFAKLLEITCAAFSTSPVAECNNVSMVSSTAAPM